MVLSALGDDVHGAAGLWIAIEGGEVVHRAGADDLAGAAEAPTDEVGIVDVQIEERAAAAGEVVVEVVAPGGRTAQAMECGAEHAAELAGLDLLVQPIPRGPESHAHAGHAELARAAGDFGEAVDIVAGDGDGLLDQHVLARAEGGDGEFDMGIGVGADAHQLDARIAEERGGIGVGGGGRGSKSWAEVPVSILPAVEMVPGEAGGVGIGDGDEAAGIAAGGGRAGTDARGADEAEADDAGEDFGLGGHGGDLG